MKKPKLKELVGISVLYGDTLADVTDVDKEGNVTLDVDGEEEVVHATELVDENEEFEPYIEAYGWSGDDSDDDDYEDTGEDEDEDTEDEDTEDGDDELFEELEELVGDDDEDEFGEDETGDELEEEQEAPEEEQAETHGGVIRSALKCLQRCVAILQQSAGVDEEDEDEEDTTTKSKGGTTEMSKKSVAVKKGMKAKALYDGEWYDVEVVAKTAKGYKVSDGEYEWEVKPAELKMKRSSRKRTSGSSSRRSTSSSSSKPKNKAQERMAILDELGVEEGDTVKYKGKRAKKWQKGEVVKIYTSASKFKGFIKVEDADGNETMIDPLSFNIKV